MPSPELNDNPTALPIQKIQKNSILYSRGVRGEDIYHKNYILEVKKKHLPKLQTHLKLSNLT